MSDTLMIQIREKFLAEYEKAFEASTGKGFYSNSDWRRLDYAVTLIPDGTTSVLDVGVGPGAMLNFLTMSGKYERTTGIDIRKYSKFVALQDDLDFRIMDVTKMEFPDNSFDVVFCMEVLEHLDVESFPKALSELRRVAKNRLVMSVPFEEEHLPPYHKQRFMRDKIAETFPRADVSLIYKPVTGAWPWAFMVEDNPTN